MPAAGIGGELEHVEVLKGPGDHGLDLPRGTRQSLPALSGRYQISSTKRRPSSVHQIRAVASRA